ncbi:MAG: GspH/FimT family pseudopilin [Oleispira antarctica]|uniref:Type II secretion system protein H n=1 Tax=Oleispira antarctica RB-8 TaxID=698738 RepID=R4YKG5_OLEAN|nr:GspH/FimT family pseudopilin [Oleispira antarctica]MBQ0791182.1 GspH/FimT family pseudopilin [Oleispira antarctica]CCK74770.1 type IV pilus biogenesis protein [Oleispira antarctica RB-8]
MKQHGFTLIELAIVLTIIALFINIGSHSYSFLINKIRVQSDTRNLLMMLRMTRLYAITHKTTSVLCPSNDNKICIKDWKQPLIQFNDVNKNNKRDDDEIIQNRFEAFKGNDLIIDYPRTQVRFNEQGIANFYNGTFSYCLDEVVKGIVISRIGRIRFAQDLDGDNIPDVNSSTPVFCK